MLTLELDWSICSSGAFRSKVIQAEQSDTIPVVKIEYDADSIADSSADYPSRLHLWLCDGNIWTSDC